ncbi:MAG: RloB domain-containing protein [Burkholderiales bacterium]|nr:RloB domain-containing protein [Burkholderiales bacterium]
MAGRIQRGRDLKRRKAVRPPYDRVLIVCEGEKTEPNYFREVRIARRLSSTHIHVCHSAFGTEPQQIVEFAEAEFRKTRAFERVYVVFDRDEHRTYANAIAMAATRDKTLRNDEGKLVPFEAAVSVPCFEAWLLMHFADCQGALHRRDAYARLRTHIAGYEKGLVGTYAATEAQFNVGAARAARLRDRFARLPGDDVYTDVDLLVAHLLAQRA